MAIRRGCTTGLLQLHREAITASTTTRDVGGLARRVLTWRGSCTKGCRHEWNETSMVCFQYQYEHGAGAGECPQMHRTHPRRKRSPGAEAAPPAGWLAPNGLAAVVVAPNPPAQGAQQASGKATQACKCWGNQAMPGQQCVHVPRQPAMPLRPSLWHRTVEAWLTKCGLCSTKGLRCAKAWAAARRAKRCAHGAGGSMVQGAA